MSGYDQATHLASLALRHSYPVPRPRCLVCKRSTSVCFISWLHHTIYLPILLWLFSQGSRLFSFLHPFDFGWQRCHLLFAPNSLQIGWQNLLFKASDSGKAACPLCQQFKNTLRRMRIICKKRMACNWTLLYNNQRNEKYGQQLNCPPGPLSWGTLWCGVKGRFCWLVKFCKRKALNT